MNRPLHQLMFVFAGSAACLSGCSTNDDDRVYHERDRSGASYFEQQPDSARAAANDQRYVSPSERSGAYARSSNTDMYGRDRSSQAFDNGVNANREAAESRRWDSSSGTGMDRPNPAWNASTTSTGVTYPYADSMAARWNGPTRDYTPLYTYRDGVRDYSTQHDESGLHYTEIARWNEKPAATTAVRVNEGRGATYTPPRADSKSSAQSTQQPASARNDARAGEDAWMTTNPDQRILSILHAANQQEIEAGRLAQQNSANAEVRSYGDMLVREHTAADTQVKNVAQTLGLTLVPKEQVQQMRQNAASSPSNDRTRMSEEARAAEETARGSAQPRTSDAAENTPASQRATGDRASTTETKVTSGEKRDCLVELRSLSGSAFDEAFAAHMAAAHQETIREVETAQTLVREPEVKDLLSKLLPKLRAHQQQAQQLAVAD